MAVRAVRAQPEPVTPEAINRELSWLDFNERVLELAADERLPLLERVKFCSIFSSNLDEFFAVRVAGLLGQVAAGVSLRSPDGRSPEETLAAIRARVLQLQANQSRLWRDELQPALALEQLTVAGPDEASPRELREVAKRFEREVSPILTPMAVGSASPFPHVSSLALSLGVLARDPASGERRFARVNVPDSLPRFLSVGKRGLHVPLEDLIVHFLPRLFEGVDVLEHAAFRITRDADFAVSDDADDLLEAVEDELRRRRFGDVVRVEVESSASRELVAALRAGLRIGEEQIYRTDAPLGLGSLLQLAKLDRAELKDAPWRPVTQRRLVNRTSAELFERIAQRDILAHHPYDAFTSSVEAFVRAAKDPDVASLKTTVYRTSDRSPIVGALVEAAEDGKQALCLVELKARFDERKNIEWSRALESAGVHVVYGVPGLKVHAKLTLLVRHEQGELRRYAHIGTGNYHATNACSYEDLSLFTADDEIAADVADVFNYVTGFSRPPVFRKLLVGPTFLRDGLVREIQAVARAATAGERALIRIKVNSLVDDAVIDELYAAARAGATVEIVTRGICALRPGVVGVSEGITVRSVLGRFLEHSRMYVFHAGERASYWIGSADLMPRNLDRRIEVLAPVENARLRGQLDDIFDALLADDRQSWTLRPDGRWTRNAPGQAGADVAAQDALMTRAKKRAYKKKPR
jgi:polyphosphate kinase